MRYFLLFLLWVTPCLASVQGDVALWLDLRKDAGVVRLTDAAAFLQRRADWPQIGLIRTNVEHMLLDSSPDQATMLRWFAANPPQTDRGRLAYWQATRSTEYLRQIWREGALNREQQQQVDVRFLKAADHAARLDNLLWDSNIDRAEDSLRYVTGSLKQRAKARIALQRFATNAVALVPSSLTEGVAFDLLRYYRQKQQDDRAAALLRYQSANTAHAALWARERMILARRAFEKNDFKTAYQLAATHPFTTGPEMADAEWFAGWIATTRLQQPGKGFVHFERMYKNVKTAQSTARAAYWAGVAADQSGQHKAATAWYGLAARHMHTFYGQLSAYALGNPEVYYQRFFQRATAITQAKQASSNLVDAATILYQMGRDEERDLFLRALLAQSSEQPQSVILIAQDLQSPEMALVAAKAAYEKGVLVKSALFPKVKIPSYAALEKNLTLGIVRQESMFDKYAISPAGALGLMQLLPSTAAHTARQCALPYSKAVQLFEPDYNLRIGQAYLSKLLERYDGFIPLAVAAYNAGPRNVDSWIAEMGDPRSDPRSWVDWVERIPFYETRNYVQRVWEAYSLYKVMQ